MVQVIVRFKNTGSEKQGFHCMSKATELHVKKNQTRPPTLVYMYKSTCSHTQPLRKSISPLRGEKLLLVQVIRRFKNRGSEK